MIMDMIRGMDRSVALFGEVVGGLFFGGAADSSIKKEKKSVGSGMDKRSAFEEGCGLRVSSSEAGWCVLHGSWLHFL